MNSFSEKNSARSSFQKLKIFFKKSFRSHLTTGFLSPSFPTSYLTTRPTTHQQSIHRSISISLGQKLCV